MNVLIVEPNPQMAEIYAAAFTGLGFEVRCACSAQVAISLMDQCRPEVVLLELALPTHNGVEFLFEMRSYAEWQEVPVVLLSSIPELDPTKWFENPTLNIARYFYKPSTNLRTMISSVQQLANIQP